MSLPTSQPLPGTTTPDEQAKKSLLNSFLFTSALSVGANLLDRKRTNASLSHALVHGIAKGAASTAILATVKPTTAVKIAASAGLIMGSGLLIDAAMKDFDSIFTKEKISKKTDKRKEVLP